MTLVAADGTFPWGTKGDLNRIGDKLRDGKVETTPREASVLEVWRASHYHVMNAFNVMLRRRTSGTSITVARRHKRRITIIDKLYREPGMQLSRMDDVAGMRLIFPDKDSLLLFRANFLRSKHNHRRRNENNKYNYLLQPKKTGYRGIHDVYAYTSSSNNHSNCNGTMIEIQYRTVHHHAWATANEVFTMLNPDQRTKFAQADEDYLEFFRIISEMFARVYDGLNSLYPDVNNKELVRRLSDIENKTRLESKLRHLNEARDIIRKTTVVLRFTSDKELYVHEPPRRQDVMKFYFKTEAEFPGDDVVLVNAPDTGGIRSAYRNYFSDTTEFFSYLDTARSRLSS